MKIHIELGIIPLSLIISFSVALGLGGLVALYFLLLRNHNLTKQVEHLDRQYEYLHNILAVRDDELLKRIEMISQINLLYGSIIEKYRPNYNYLLNDKDVYVYDKLLEFKEHIASKKYRQVRKQIPEFKQYLTEFNKEVTLLHNNLLQIIRPEEECNHILTDAEENYRLIRQEYDAHKEGILILKNSYTTIFKHLDKLFEEYRQYVDQANYEDATQLMPKIQKILSALDTANRALPDLCRLVNHDVPLRITDLENELKRAQFEGYPVSHIITSKEISEMRDELHTIVDNLKMFSYKTANEQLAGILKKVDDCFALFKKEREAKKEFDKEFNPIYTHINEISRNFIKLTNSLPNIQKYYVISDEKTKMCSIIHNHVNRIGIEKQALDNSLHRSMPEPFTVLLEKTLDLKKESQEIEKEMEGFKQYLISLKVDVNKAHDLIFEYYYRLRKVEKIMRDSSLSFFENKYKDKVNEIYQQLDIINTTSFQTPIDVEKINNAVNVITYKGESLINQIEQEHNMLNLAESAITYLNQHRKKYSQINTLLSQSEKMFFDGEFEKAYNATSDIIKRYNELENR